MQDKLKSIRYGQSFKELTSLKVIHINGSDAISFLQGQVTSDVHLLLNKQFQYSALLDNKGKLVSSFLLLKENSENFYLLVENEYLDKTVIRLNTYLVSEDVQVKEAVKTFYGVWGIISPDMSGYYGKLYNEDCCLAEIRPGDIDEMRNEDLELLRFASGEPVLGREVLSGELITNSFLTELAISTRKGCYPGQETVSKIMNNRGAAFYPVCLVSEKKIDDKVLKSHVKKIAELKALVQLENNYYYYALVSREFRVKDMIFEVSGACFKVQYFPLFANSLKDKANDLYYSAIEAFQKDQEHEAIESLQKVIKLEPEFEDAYEALGVIYGRMGDNQQAIELMQKLSKINPRSVMAHTNLSLYFMKMGDKEQAEEHKSLATLKQFEMLGEEAKVKNALKEKETARREELNRKENMLKQVLEIDSEDALANLGMGEIELERKNYNRAQDFLERAIQSDPNYSVAYLALAKTLLAGQNLELLRETLILGISIATKQGELMPANEMQSIFNANFSS